jgi:hypothetical protein
VTDTVRKGRKSKLKGAKGGRAAQKSRVAEEPVPKAGAESESSQGPDPAEALKRLQEAGSKSRVDRIKESHALLQQFNVKELKLLMNLKRNTSPKAWTLREDLVVLTLPMSNREIAEVLKDRNKEAVKKRLQLLRSKGLNKR